MTERHSPDSPWIQAGRLTFLALYAVTVLAALAWAFSNVRQIDPQNPAVNQVYRPDLLPRNLHHARLCAACRPAPRLALCG